jgi:hypothetical protein
MNLEDKKRKKQRNKEVLELELNIFSVGDPYPYP